MHHANFENIFNALQTLFVFSSLEGWPGVMHNIVDGDLPASGPSFESFKTIKIYIIAFIIIGSLFFMNLFIGVIFDEYSNQVKEEENTVKFLNPNHEAWLEVYTMIYDTAINF